MAVQKIIHTINGCIYNTTYLLLLLAHTVQNFNLKLSSSSECDKGALIRESFTAVPLNPVVVESGSAGGGGGGGGAARRLGSADIVKDVKIENL